MLRGIRRSDMKSRMTPRRLSRVDWVMTQIVRIGKILVCGMLLVLLGLWIWAGGVVTRAEAVIQSKIANVAADMGFRIRDVTVEGRHNLPQETLKQIVGVQPGDPLLAVDLQILRAQLEKNPWVKDVSVRRALPDHLVITLIERQPLAIWLDAPGSPGIIDGDGIVLTQSGFEKFGPLLAVTGEGSEKKASALIALLKAQPDVAVRITRAVYVSQRRWDLVMDQGTIVKLPEDDAGLALARLSKAQADEKILDEPLKSIDLRQADRVIIENKPGHIRDLLVKNGDPA